MKGQASELVLQDVVVCREQVVAGNKFGDLETLVHRLLDQRVTAQRADDVQTVDVRFVAAGQFG